MEIIIVTGKVTSWGHSEVRSTVDGKSIEYTEQHVEVHIQNVDEEVTIIEDLMVTGDFIKKLGDRGNNVDSEWAIITRKGRKLLAAWRCGDDEEIAFTRQQLEFVKKYKRIEAFAYATPVVLSALIAGAFPGAALIGLIIGLIMAWGLTYPKVGGPGRSIESVLTKLNEYGYGLERDKKVLLSDENTGELVEAKKVTRI